ncbi:fructosamine kinase family protein [Swaminathania salitolerans]|uniref:Fructosamine kinase family protein n=1 Tax=Swaminathania salitolerans TaxID=182838 RepID=A0A511BRN6_9PROT|nr:fructosamine kinase family protein [Swaminathania salitolerans]GBQ14335.1 fructosamine-3-kinase [Swaminathania salitolerans LMG 21291]GEL02996.1 fructosamine kinase family protein [Swaminathania salitolerans]
MSERLVDAARLIGEKDDFDAMPLGGGDLSEIWHLRFPSGREAVVKIGGQPQIEAAMLESLAGTGVTVPQVLGVAADLLVLSYFPPARTDWAALGAAMARLHATPQPGRYGWDADYAFGTVPIENGWDDDWRRFWREKRLRPFLGGLPREHAARVHHVMERIDTLLPEAPRAVLLHGDLWSGNVVYTPDPAGGTRAALIDPACFVGDASADFAILTLFASPPPAFWEAYGPLPSGYERSILAYRLWPALVHCRLFGATYLPLLDRCLDAISL